MNKEVISRLSVICFSQNPYKTPVTSHLKVTWANHNISQDDYICHIEQSQSELIALIDADRISVGQLHDILKSLDWDQATDCVGYVGNENRKLILGTISSKWGTDSEILRSPIILGSKESLSRAYGGQDLGGSVMTSVGYSLQKAPNIKFKRLTSSQIHTTSHTEDSVKINKLHLWSNYTFRLPIRYVASGNFFRQFTSRRADVERNMLYRMLLFCLIAFVFAFMPLISSNYGVSGDEFVDHRHAGYVLDYFATGDKAALNQPTTTLHLYGNSVQVVTAALCRWFDVQNTYELRHFICSIIGALGVLFVGLLGLRWGGGLCGLLSALIILLCPRFFGHSMNNLKDIPFAVGYIIAIFYTVRLFERCETFRLQHMLGLILGVTLALGTRSGGLILYPMIFMYAGLRFISQHGVRNFYKLRIYGSQAGKILLTILIVVVCSYLLSICLWPFALQKPLTGVVYSLSQFTNYTVGLRTTFDGAQVMSNMLPWTYGPKYLGIGLPEVMIFGFIGYAIYAVIRRKELSLVSFFLFFVAIFPIFWVIYQNSNLYGGIRHLLFVMPVIAILAGRFWSEIIHLTPGRWKIATFGLFVGLLTLPAIHMVRNHPNQYVYFNGMSGGIDKAYGNYETDYYFNSLKESADWFRANILPTLPKDTTTTIVTQAIHPVSYYFRNDPNIKVVYSLYYKKHSIDWDYAIFGNVYISPSQLKEGLFPPQGNLYSASVDGYPMSSVVHRDTKLELQGIRLEDAGQTTKALEVFNSYIKNHPNNEEIWARISRLYFIIGQSDSSMMASNNALRLNSGLNEALYMKAMVYIDRREYSKAAEVVGEMFTTSTVSADGKYLKATILYRQKHYQNALDVISELLQTKPNSDKAMMLAGYIFRDNSDFRQAANMYQQAFNITPQINILVQLADMTARMKNFTQAESMLQKAIEAQPSFYPIYKVKLRMSLMQGDTTKAKEYLAKIESIGDNTQNDAELYVLRAMIAEKLGDSKTALEMTDKALATDPDNVEAAKMKNKN